MNQSVLGALGASLCLLFAAPLATNALAGDASSNAQASITVIGKSPLTCVDCEAPSAMSITLCHSTTVTLTIGSSQIGSFGTGHSSSACVTAPSVAPGQCVWFEYHYTCTRGGFFGTWNCTPVGANTVVGDNPFC